MSTVNFDRDLHRYSDDSGVSYPSVTELLAYGKIVDFSVVREEIRQRAMKRGTSVHWVCQLYDEGALNVRTVPKVIRGELKAWKLFRSNSGFEPVLIEKPFISPWGFAGTPDRFGQFPDGSWAVIDLKSGQGAVAKWVAIQTAPYAKWYAISERLPRIRRIGVKLHNDGTYQVKEFPIAELTVDFAKFCQVLQKWKEEHGN